MTLTMFGRDLDDLPPAGGFVVWVYELEGHASLRELLRHIARLERYDEFRGIAWQGRHAFTGRWGDDWAQIRVEVPGDAPKYVMRPADNQFWRVVRSMRRKAIVDAVFAPLCGGEPARNWA